MAPRLPFPRACRGYTKTVFSVANVTARREPTIAFPTMHGAAYRFYASIETRVRSNDRTKHDFASA